MLTSPSKAAVLHPDVEVDVAPAGTVPPLPRTEVAIVRTSAAGFPACTGNVATGAADGGGGEAGLAFRPPEKAAVLEPSCCEHRSASLSRPGGHSDGTHKPEVPLVSWRGTAGTSTDPVAPEGP